jgi:MFS family permease
MRGCARAAGTGSGWLWAAFAVSAFGTWIAFDAFPLIAILVLHAGAGAVSALAATGLAAGALVGVPLGPWVERRRKRRVMVGMDLLRCVALLTVPLAYLLGALSPAQLLAVPSQGRRRLRSRLQAKPARPLGR